MAPAYLLLPPELELSLIYLDHTHRPTCTLSTERSHDQTPSI